MQVCHKASGRDFGQKLHMLPPRDNAMVHSHSDKTAYHKFHNVDAPYVTNLHPFGEMATVLDPTKHKLKAKLINKGQLCMMLSPALDHSHDTVKMWNVKTRQFIFTRDACWLNKTYGSHFNHVMREFD